MNSTFSTISEGLGTSFHGGLETELRVHKMYDMQDYRGFIVAWWPLIGRGLRILVAM